MEENGYRTWQDNAAQDMDRWQQTEGTRERQEREARELAAARKHFSKLGGMYLLGTIVIFAVQFAVSFAAGLLFPEWLMNGDFALLLSMVPMYAIGMPVLIARVRTIPADRVGRRPIRAGSFIAAVVMCFGAVYLTNIIGNIVTTVIGMLKGSGVQNQLLNVTESVSLWMIAFWMVICAPVMEEYVFRKLIVDRTVRYGQGTAVLLSGLMFGLFHGNLNQFVYAFVLGMLLAYLYVKTGNLKITIAIHMMINFMGGLVSSMLMRQIDLDAYLEMAANLDMASMMAFVSENMAGLLAYGVFLIFVFGCLIGGLVLFIVCLARRKFSFARGRIVIPAGKRFRTVALNLGMLLYGIFWIAVIVYQLLA